MPRQHHERAPAARPGAAPRSARPAGPAAVVLALQRTAGNAAVSRVLQRQKADAETYVATHTLGIEATHAKVKAYVEDTAKPKDHRKGLLAAWNKDRGGGDRWTIEEPADLAGGDNPYRHDTWDVYRGFTKETTGVEVDIFGGKVSAFYNRGAPKIGSANANWPGAKLGDSYVEYVRGLRLSGLTDPQIATALLDLDDSNLVSLVSKRAAAMMTVTVYLAEEWRKQGAAKLYRAILRTIKAGTRTFDDLLDDFDFIASARAGREKIAEFQDVYLGASDLTSLSARDQDYYGAMSPIQDDDLSSDDEMRTDDKKNLKGKRLFASHHM